MEGVHLDFAAVPVGASEAREWSVARTESGEHQITIRRQVWTSRACEDLDANLLTVSARLVVRIEEGWEGPQHESATVCRYTARIRNLPSGRYNLSVIHVQPDGRRSRTAVVRQTLDIR